MRKMFLFLLILLCTMLTSCNIPLEEETKEKTKEKTKEITEEYKEDNVFDTKLRNVMPKGKSFIGITDTLDIKTSSGVSDVYEETSGKGYVVIASANGFSESVEVVIGIGADGYIVGIDVAMGSRDFSVNDQTISSFIGEDSTLSGVIFTSGATVSSMAVKTAVSNSFDVLLSNGLLQATLKSPEQIYEELLPTVYSSFVKGEELHGTGNIKYAIVAKNRSSIVCYVEKDGKLLLGVYVVSGPCAVFQTKLIDEDAQMYELENITSDNLSITNEIMDFASSHISNIFSELESKIIKKYDSATNITQINVSSFSTVVAAASFKVEGSTYYAYYARPIHGFQNDVMDIWIVLDSDGKIANIDVKQYFYGHVEYFAPANSFNSSSYESGLIGLTSETYHGYETVVSGATHTSKAIETAIRNTLTEFNRIK